MGATGGDCAPEACAPCRMHRRKKLHSRLSIAIARIRGTPSKQQQRSHFGNALCDALGVALGDALGDALGAALGDALGDALGVATYRATRATRHLACDGGGGGGGDDGGGGGDVGEDGHGARIAQHGREHDTASDGGDNGGGGCGDGGGAPQP